MRVIGGQSKGRKILSLPKKSGVRPIHGRIRQSLFDIIRLRVPGSWFLDLFAGTGTVGLESLSRGAEKAVFLESSLGCVKVIEKNLGRFGYQARARVFKSDVLKGLSWILYYVGGRQFDLIFVGPPYKDRERKPLSLVGPTLALIVKGRVLSPEGLVVAQHHKGEAIEVPGELELFRQRKYGDNMLSFFKRK